MFRRGGSRTAGIRAALRSLRGQDVRSFERALLWNDAKLKVTRTEVGWMTYTGRKSKSYLGGGQEPGCELRCVCGDSLAAV